MNNNQHTYIAYLYPHSTFRGELRSDTLWGMICWGIRFLYGQEELQALLAQYKETPPFVVSSAFPFAEKDNNKSLFFPRPYLPQKDFDRSKLEREKAIHNMKERKEIKDVAYISLEVLNRLCEGITPDEMQAALKEKLSDNSFVPAIKTDSATHSQLNRITNKVVEKNEQGQLYHTNEKYVSAPKEGNAGLFFLIKSDENNWVKIQAVLRWLAHTGIGGDRNIGKGVFDIETACFTEIKTSTAPNAYLSFSLFMPNEIERALLVNNDDKLLNYQITFRKGFVGNATQNFYDKKNLAAFVEGSVFPMEVKGEIKNSGFVTEMRKDKAYTYNIYQNGCAFTIPITINF